MQYIVTMDGTRRIIEADTPYAAAMAASGHGGITMTSERTLPDGRRQYNMEVQTGPKSITRISITTVSEWLQNRIPSALNAGA